jgi:hypothetical protein
MLRLDYISCCLTIASTVLVGRRLWHGWIVAGVNSAILCIIGFDTRQTGFIPANLFCIALYSYNLWNWRSPGGPTRVRDLAETASCRTPLAQPGTVQKQRFLSKPKHHMTKRSIRIPD